MTLVVNLWGGPGTGKSTNATLAFGKLKVEGVECEYVHEYAKDLTWEKRDLAIRHQPYIMAKQQFHIERLFDQVECIITDSPLPLGLVYRGPAFTQGLGTHLIETFRKWTTVNILLRRDVDHHPYVEAGRNQTLEEAETIDKQIEELLRRYEITYVPLRVLEGERTAEAIVDVVQSELFHLQHPSPPLLDGTPDLP